MIINEPPNWKEDPSFIVNEGATCGNCPYFYWTGYCRREGILGEQVDPDDWCGRHPFRIMTANQDPVPDEEEDPFRHMGGEG